MDISTSPKLQKVIERVLESPHSDFYRKKYHSLQLAAPLTALTWESIPFLTREEIVSTPLLERLYIEPTKLELIRVTSGTSGKGVLLVPRIQLPGHVSSVYDDLFSRYTFNRLASFAGASFRSIKSFKQNYNTETISLPVSDIPTAGLLIESFNADAIFGFGYALEAVGKFISPQRRQAIKVVHLFGEHNSALRLNLLRQMYEHATIISEYSSVDAQTIVGLPCTKLVEAGSTDVHPIPEHAYCEIISPESGELISEPNVTGELVITVIQETAFPLIRYRTGDLAQIRDENCSCGIKSPVLAILGRKEGNKVRFRGGEIQLAEVERAFGVVTAGKAVSLLETQFIEEVFNETLLARLKLVIKVENTHELDQMATKLATELRVAPNLSYREAVEKKLVLPLVVTQADPKEILRKSRGIVTTQ